VIQGRGSQFILKHHPAALHVLVVAPLADRVKRVMISEEVDAGKARKLIKEHDSSRRLFIRRFFQRDIENPDYYDMIINTKTLHFGAAARIIAGAAQEKKSW
jgi:cytidylate kinase